MGAVPSKPQQDTRPPETAEFLVSSFIGEKAYPLASDFWQKFLEFPLDFRSRKHQFHRVCELFAQNNFYTRHLCKVLIHLSFYLRECTSKPVSLSSACTKAVNAVHVSAMFLKYIIENLRSEKAEAFCLYLDQNEPIPEYFCRALKLSGKSVEHLVVQSILNFIASVEVSHDTFLLHHELLNFLLVVMSTQLVHGSFLEQKDANPFIDAAMSQDKSLVASAVQKLLLNYVLCPPTMTSGSIDGYLPGVLERVGSFAANVVLFPLSYLVGSGGMRNLVRESSLLVLLILIYYRKRVISDELRDAEYGKSGFTFAENPYCGALQSARNIGVHPDIERSAGDGLVVRLPFTSLFDTLSTFLSDETAVLLLYSLLHGNSDFLEYVLVRTDLDTMLVPLLESIYDGKKRTSHHHMYMVLIVLLILSQDPSFNSGVHRIVLPSVSWYQECVLHQTPLGSLLVIVLIRAVKMNLSRLHDVYLLTSCLAVLANMAPHVDRLTAHASQRLISLFDVLARRYMKLHDDREATSTQISVYTDFLRIVLEIINAVLCHALPQNPEVVYAVMHRQETFGPFKSDPHFQELVENIYTVLDFFNRRMMNAEGEDWSVETVLRLIVDSCRFWHGEGMKVLTEMRFTYEQESQPEEFFIPYVWQLVLPRSSLSFDPDKITLFSACPPPDVEGDELAGGEVLA